MPPRTSPPHPVGHRLADFSDLLPAEIALRAACREGKVAWISDKRPEAKTEANHIRPKVLRVFCLGLDPEAPVHEKGVQLHGAWIEDVDGSDLDLEGCHLPAPLQLWKCHLIGRVVAFDATARQLGFDGTRCARITADRLTCTGSVYLRNGFRAEGPVRFGGADIDGFLDCTDATFATSEGDALAFDGAKIGGTVFLNGKFRSEKKVHFLGADIGGNLECTDATFAASEGDALSFDRAKIGGSVFLNGTFRAEGLVRFPGAVIGGNLACKDATFAASEGDALAFDGAKIGGAVFLNGKFRAEKKVRFLGAAIGGNLECDGGQFAGDPSLDLTKSVIGGNAFFCNGFHAAGEVGLQAAEIDVLVDEEAAWVGSTLRLDGLTIRRFAGVAPVDAAARIRWLERQPPHHLGVDFRPQPWEECARVLAGMGHERDARILRIKKRRRMRRLPWMRAKTVAARGWAVVTFALDLIVDVTTGYGWRPLNALVGLVILWLVAGIGYGQLPAGVMAPADALVYFSPRIPLECRADWITFVPPPPAADDLSRRWNEAGKVGLAATVIFVEDNRGRREVLGPPYPHGWQEICTRAMPSEYSTFSPFAYAADVLLPIVDLRQEHDWSPRVTDAKGEVIAPLWTGASWGWGYLARLTEWALILAGWGLSALLLGAVTGVIRRD